MDRHQFYSVGEESPSSILWDLDSSSLIVPAYYRPVPQVETMRREISEESGYLTSTETSSSQQWPSTVPSDWPIDYQSWTTAGPAPTDLHGDDCWLLQEQEVTPDECWEIPNSEIGLVNCSTDGQQVPYQPPIATSTAGRSGSTSSDDSVVCVPSGKKKVFQLLTPFPLVFAAYYGPAILDTS